MYSTLSLEEKRALRQEQKKEKKEYKQQYEEERKKESCKQLHYITEQINYMQNRLSRLEQQHKVAKSQNKKHISNQIHTTKLEIAFLHVDKCKLDVNFMQRNMVHTNICPKVVKGKECKYEDCWYAHTSDELRIPKCIPQMYDCCDNGNMCKYDHTDSPLPELPKRLEYSYSVSEEEELCIRDQYNSYFKLKIEETVPSASQEIKEQLYTNLSQSSIKDCTQWVISDKLFIQKITEHMNKN